MTVTVTPIVVADVQATPDERLPVCVHVVDLPGTRILVDTGFDRLHPLIEDMAPRLHDWHVDGVDLVVSTHLHYDHCGGNHRFAGLPFHVQRQELEDALGLEDHTIREWVQPPGVTYTAHDGEHELLPGVRLVPAPGHTRGLQMVVFETEDRPVVVGGDVVVWWGELDGPELSEGQQRLLALDPAEVWITHEREPLRR